MNIITPPQEIIFFICLGKIFNLMPQESNLLLINTLKLVVNTTLRVGNYPLVVINTTRIFKKIRIYTIKYEFNTKKRKYIFYHKVLIISYLVSTHFYFFII